MIEFYVQGQSMKMFSPVIAADSLNYLTCKFNFSGEDWDDYVKTAHFTKRNTSPAITYDIQLVDDEIKASSHLNLAAGIWDVYLTGVYGTARLTSVVNTFTVKVSGLVDAPLHELPLSLAEQIDAKASTALLQATAVQQAAERGDFNGKDGKGFVIVGYYETLAELQAEVTDPKEGEMYGVGAAEPYNIYAYDFVNLEWVNNGTIQGPAGEKGDDGTVFTPAVDSTTGVISWTNDGGKTNPPSVNIKGPKGDDGSTGPAGTSAYEAAVAGGYTGTEATFNSAMSTFPYHNARHAAGGADPILVATGNLNDGAVTKLKLAANATNSTLTVSLSAAGWSNNEQTVSASGVTESNTVIVSPAAASHVAYGEAGVRCTAQGSNTLTFVCENVPASALTVNVVILT